MSEIILFVYRNQSDAFAAGEALAVMQRKAGTEPEDIVVITRDGEGRISLNQSIDLATGQPLGGGLWGMTIGTLFLDRRTEAQSETGLAAQLRAAGINASFLRDAATALRDGGAVVGMRVRLLGASRVQDHVAGLKGAPRVLRTRLSADTEDALYDMQDRIPDAVLRHAAPDGMF